MLCVYLLVLYIRFIDLYLALTKDQYCYKQSVTETLHELLSQRHVSFREKPEAQQIITMLCSINAWLSGMRWFQFVIISFSSFFISFFSKVVQEYERAAIFRLGRALPGARGPGQQICLSSVRCMLCVQACDAPSCSSTKIILFIVYLFIIYKKIWTWFSLKFKKLPLCYL